jgi:hypothetical protein
MRSVYVPMRKVLPPADLGDAQIIHYSISEKEASFSAMRAAVTANRHEEVDAGKYVRLMINNSLVMSDTSMEKRSNLGFIWNANGKVFVAGLGIGLILIPALREEKVEHIEVIEKNPNVIQLVENPLREFLTKNQNKKLTIFEGDVLEYKPAKGCTWDTIYFDIWADICTDNLEEITKLKRKFARRLNRANPACWMGAWKEEELRYYKRTAQRW